MSDIFAGTKQSVIVNIDKSNITRDFTNLSAKIFRNNIETSLGSVITEIVNNNQDFSYTVSFDIPENWEIDDIVTVSFSFTLEGFTRQKAFFVGIVRRNILRQVNNNINSIL